MATDWIEVGSERMLHARKKQRFSIDEVAYRMARNGYKAIGRTYARWEKRGEVPREALPVVAAVLGLDAGRILADQPTRVQVQQVADSLAQIVAATQALTQIAVELRSVVDELRPRAAANS